MTDPVSSALQQMYQPLVGTRFLGTYKGTLVVPQTTEQRDIISVDPFALLLNGVSRAVVQSYGQQVWKGITDPEQSPNPPEYWLWVEPTFNGTLQMGKSYTFEVTKCTPASPFHVAAFSHGVSISCKAPNL